MCATAPQYVFIALEGNYTRGELCADLGKYGNVRTMSRLAELATLMADMMNDLEQRSAPTTKAPEAPPIVDTVAAEPVAPLFAEANARDEPIQYPATIKDEFVDEMNDHPEMYADGSIQQSLADLLDRAGVGASSTSNCDMVHSDANDAYCAPSATVHTSTDEQTGDLQFDDDGNEIASTKTFCHMCRKKLHMPAKNHTAHITVHMTIKKYRCADQNCGYETYRSTNIRSHLAVIHGDRNAPFIDILADPRPEYVELARLWKAEREVMLERCFPEYYASRTPRKSLLESLQDTVASASSTNEKRRAASEQNGQLQLKMMRVE